MKNIRFLPSLDILLIPKQTWWFIVEIPDCDVWLEPVKYFVRDTQMNYLLLQQVGR